jgi:hypothetical protein
VIGLVNEPTAAAINFAHLHLSDLSAGKRAFRASSSTTSAAAFDCSAVSLEGQRFD